MRRRLKTIFAALVAAPREAAVAASAHLRKLGNADTALFAGWAMVTIGCGLASVSGGLIVGGLLLIGGALFTARGSE